MTVRRDEAIRDVLAPCVAEWTPWRFEWAWNDCLKTIMLAHSTGKFARFRKTSDIYKEFAVGMAFYEDGAMHFTARFFTKKDVLSEPYLRDLGEAAFRWFSVDHPPTIDKLMPRAAEAALIGRPDVVVIDDPILDAIMETLDEEDPSWRNE